MSDASDREVREYPQPIPRGQNLTQRTLEHFHFWGAEPALRAARTIPREYGIGGMTAYGALLSGIIATIGCSGELVRPSISWTTNAYRNMRPKLSCVRGSVSFRRSKRCTAGPPKRWRRTTWCRSFRCARGSGETRRLRAEYAVGCDGSRSLVRDACGITQTKSDHDRLMVLLVFRFGRTPRKLLEALSEQVVLQRPASGPERLLALLRSGRSRHDLVLSRASPDGHYQRQLRFPRAGA